MWRWRWRVGEEGTCDPTMRVVRLCGLSKFESNILKAASRTSLQKPMIRTVKNVNCVPFFVALQECAVYFRKFSPPVARETYQPST